jgi:hypothetical protein
MDKKLAEEALQKLQIATAALIQIRREEGKVCDNFKLCDHRACQSSYSSWYIANEALKKICK